LLKEIKIKSNLKNEFIDITEQINIFIKESKFNSGLCTIYCPHTTAGITVNENADPDVKKDLLNAFEEIVPKINFDHVEGNSDSHLKALLTGTEKTFIIENNSLILGQWQSIYFTEFDGPRNRKVFVKLIKYF
jgi:secondary thiamine-phosphate synthase enzyme